MDQPIIDMINDRMNRMEDKIDRILEFKWQIIGGSVFISILFTVGISLAGIYFTK